MKKIKQMFLIRFLSIALLVLAMYSCEKENKKHFAFVYGHGGTSLFPERYIYPPNSEESIIYALDFLDADGVEVDVQMTRDSVLVLFHDERLDINTDVDGCVNDKLFSEIAEAKYAKTKYGLVGLNEVMGLIHARNKRIFLDVKPYNFCSENEIDFQVFNNALNTIIEGLSEIQKKNITVNSTSIDLLNCLEDSLIQRSFETSDINLGMAYYQNYNLDKLCLKYNLLDEGEVSQLRDANIPICIFGIKTQKDIKNAHSFLPFELISDNIAFAKKQSN